MLLVGCLDTALCWNGRWLTLGRNFLTLFFQLTAFSNHYTECSPPPPLHSIHQKGLLPFRMRTHHTFPQYRTELLGVCASQFWIWTSLSNAVMYLLALLSRVLKTQCRDMLLNLGACNSGAGTTAQECVLRYQGGHHTDDNRLKCVLKMAASPCHIHSSLECRSPMDYTDISQWWCYNSSCGMRA
jgi:hypothetical protein